MLSVGRFSPHPNRYRRNRYGRNRYGPNMHRYGGTQIRAQRVPRESRELRFVKRCSAIAFAAILLGSAGLAAQSPATTSPPTSTPTSTPNSTPTSPTASPQLGKPASVPPPSDGNPFPGEAAGAPILPIKSLLSESGEGEQREANRHIPTTDSDPLRSPDDTDASGGVDTLFSSSLSGVHDHSLLGDDSATDEKTPTKRRRPLARDIPHQETAAQDIQVGNYYLDRKNWKAALSRFQSARILDPENPAAFFGMAEAEQHLGDVASARAHYEIVLTYDPEGPQSKAARKALRELPSSAANTGQRQEPPVTGQPVPQSTEQPSR